MEGGVEGMEVEEGGRDERGLFFKGRGTGRVCNVKRGSQHRITLCGKGEKSRRVEAKRSKRRKETSSSPHPSTFEPTLATMRPAA